MRLVVADAGPLNYLILIEQVGVLPGLFEKVFVPDVVRNELRHEEAPEAVRKWSVNLPPWIEIVATDPTDEDPTLEQLDHGERAAIQLAVRIGAELVLMDDRAGVSVARSKGFAVTGTLGILDLCARRGLIRLDEALHRLKATNFRCRAEIMDALLAQYKNEGKDSR